MDQQAIVETVFKSVIAAFPTELGALLGQELSCGEAKCQIASKEQLFAGEPRPKSSLSHLKVVGDHEGEAFLVLSTKTSIVFGGTLIMLPQSQIDENSKNETLDGEVADAYGEVANIIAGVLTQVFLDKYSKSLRFVRTEVEEMVHSAVDIASDAPFPAGDYFHFCSELSMGGNSLGLIEIITPVILFDLDAAKAAPATEPAAEASTEAEVKIASEPEPTPMGEETNAVPPAPQRPPFADAKKVADVVLKATIGQVGEEVGALLGQEFTCTDLKLEMITKGDFFASYCMEKSVLTNLEISGSTTGTGYLIQQLKDAIMMGGTLIMLPEEEIASSIGKGIFDGEVLDAHGEVANIISGGLTQTFIDRFPAQLRFVKTTAEIIVPTKIIMESEAPFPDGLFYLASCAIALQGKPLDRMHLLFPAEVLGLENQVADSALAAASPQAQEGEPKAATGRSPASGGESSPSKDAKSPSKVAPSRQAPAPPADAKPVILVISDAQEAADAFSKNLQHDTYDVEIIGYKDDVRAVFSAHPVLGVFLLMSEVGEKGFSVAIKLQSCGYTLPPVIAAGPEWTRSAVLKAVQYGARDILVTPASDDEIRTKASQHLSLPA